MSHELNSRFNLVYMQGHLLSISFHCPEVCTVPRPQDVDHYVHLEWFSGVLRSSEHAAPVVAHPEFDAELPLNVLILFEFIICANDQRHGPGHGFVDLSQK